jgi:transposase
MRYELTDHEWAAIKPMLPNKALGAHGLAGAVEEFEAQPLLELAHLLESVGWETCSASAARVKPPCCTTASR